MGCRNGRDQRTNSEVRARRYLYQMRPYTEEPGAEQFACPVLDWRRVERSTRRPYGKQRPLGIPSFRDKLLGTVLKLILEAIYEPTFSKHSHGFRPDRSCHTALATVKREMNGVRWWVEGDIKGCFDHVNHDTLLSILSKRITDKRFLHLIGQFLKAGYAEDWRYHQTYS